MSLCKLMNLNLKKRKYNRGHRVERAWVVGSNEKTREGLIVFQEVKNKNQETVIRFIRKYIKPGSIIISDCWRGYMNVKSFEYTHFTANHSISFVDQEPEPIKILYEKIGVL
ncbi:hypothetical protein DMUE_1958 [Dictyocoela muelleri]|nr:hypothetical protein DMUE_1958 [Dictyocoela muelleri]